MLKHVMVYAACDLVKLAGPAYLCSVHTTCRSSILDIKLPCQSFFLIKKVNRGRDRHSQGPKPEIPVYHVPLSWQSPMHFIRPHSALRYEASVCIR